MYVCMYVCAGPWLALERPVELAYTQRSYTLVIVPALAPLEPILLKLEEEPPLPIVIEKM
jgi:hypothetical protein